MADLLVQIKWHMLSQEKKQETLQRGITMEGKRKSRSVVQEDLFVTNNYGVSKAAVCLCVHMNLFRDLDLAKCLVSCYVASGLICNLIL